MVTIRVFRASAVIDLRIRDMRWLELNYQHDPTILVRRHATLVALDPIHAIVMSDKLLLIVPPGADTLLGILGDYMNGRWYVMLYITYCGKE